MQRFAVERARAGDSIEQIGLAAGIKPESALRRLRRGLIRIIGPEEFNRRVSYVNRHPKKAVVRAAQFK